MTITIRATAAPGTDTAGGVNFDTYVAAFFAQFTMLGWPVFGGGNSTSGDQIHLLDAVEPDPEDTPIVLLDGEDMEYDFPTHTVTGLLERVRLGVIGDSYDGNNLTTDGQGRVINTTTTVDVTGLSVSDAAFHELLSGLMDGDPAPLLAVLAAQAQHFIGSAGADRYTGTAFADTAEGGSGADTLRGAAGNDTLQGGAGNDTLDGGTGADTLRGGDGNDVYRIDNPGDRALEDSADGGYDTVYSTVGHTLALHVDRLILEGTGNLAGTGNAAANRLDGNAGANQLSGGAGNDKLFGNAGNDTLNGGTGNDVMTGGVGDDLYYVDAAGDKVVEAAAGGNDTVRSTVGIVLAANVEQLILVGSADLFGNGNAGANRIVGNAGDNKLNGLAGDDQLFGSAGADTLNGGAGKDRLTGGAAADVFRFVAASDSPANAGRDVIVDFQHLVDDIDLSSIDANSGVAGNQAFTFVGAAAFSGVAGQLRHSGLILQGDVNGDGVADFQIELTGGPAVTAADLLL